MAKSLFITYDGLTDPLGQSQILPYLTGLSLKGHEIHVLSCEKKERFGQNRQAIETVCTQHNIHWTPLRFHTKPPVLSKYYDLFKLRRAAAALHRQEAFDLIHCRSYLSATIGRELKIAKGVKYLFDMRGFWVDERVDGGLWNLKRFIYRQAYRTWKKKEAALIRDADHIISLTLAGKKEIESWPVYEGNPITVVPCSADLNLFSLTDDASKKEARNLLGISENMLVLSYLGSLGTWYLLDEMLLLFRVIKEKFNDAKFLILTPDSPEKVYSRLSFYQLHPDDIVIRFAQRKDVPKLIKASDVSVSFIKPSYSKIASSPTKLGELLAMGIPVICNSIGDVEKIVELTNGGMIVHGFDRDAFQGVIPFILHTSQPGRIKREKVIEYYGLDKAVESYDKVYRLLVET